LDRVRPGTGTAFICGEGLFIGLALALLLSGVAAGDDTVILKSRRFVPPAGLSESLRARVPGDVSRETLRVTQDDGATGGRVHVIIQLADLPTAQRRIELLDAGVRLLSYIPNRSWLASVEADKLGAAAALPGVRAITEILPEDKLAPSLREGGINAYSLMGTGQAWLAATLFEDVDLQAGVAAVEELGGACLNSDPDLNCLVLRLPVAALRALAARDCVKWIDQHYESVDLNDRVRAAINVNAVQAAPYNLTGAGVLLGQWESKHPDATHADLAGRVTNVDDGLPVGDHATLVAGTMIGDGGLLLPNRLYRGMATAAAIVSFGTWEDATELRKQYREAINLYNIDIANNSWGKVEWNTYTEYAGLFDGIVRGDLGKPMPMVWATGNEGSWGTILCTAVAKNIVAVGATNSDDDSLWAWSNRGPTEDGRLKPDVVSPGCETVNGGAIWSTLPGNRYGGACGTSLAAPSVSGVMALVVEDWRATHDGDPLPSTIKALLLHTAQDLGEPGPDYAYGYGLIDARAAIDLVRADTLDDVVAEDAIEQQDEHDYYVLDISADTKVLKVTLVWDDYPADPLTGHALVNDLDLVVTDPNGQQHYPWTLDPYLPQDPAVRTQADHTNNVEQVFVERPAEGRWQIAVWGMSVPQGPQEYSLLTGLAPLADIPLGRPILSITGALGQPVAWFDDRGNLVLHGVLTTGVESTPPAGAFVIHSPNEEIAGYIDLDGNMCLRGELTESAECTLIGGGFIVRDWFGKVVACVDMAGNLCLAGRLQQNMPL
jgi:hypothetical protein